MSLGFTQRFVIPVTIVDPLADDQRIHLFRAPLDGEILSAEIVCQDAQASGSAGTFQLENWGSAGTAVSGTIAVGLGGTAVADRLSAETPASYVITQGTLSEDDWVVIDYQETGNFVEAQVRVVVTGVWGIGADA